MVEIWSAANYRADTTTHKLDDSHCDSASTPIRIRCVSSWRLYDERGFARRPIRANCPPIVYHSTTSLLAIERFAVVHLSSPSFPLPWYG